MGAHQWNVYTTYRMGESYDKSAYIVQIAYIFAIGLVKISILLLYLRTFTASRRSCWTIYVL